MILTKDIWLGLDKGKKVKEISEALTMLKEIDTKGSSIKSKLSQGRLANVKKSLEESVINAISWETERNLQRH